MYTKITNDANDLLFDYLAFIWWIAWMRICSYCLVMKTRLFRYSVICYNLFLHFIRLLPGSSRR